MRVNMVGEGVKSDLCSRILAVTILLGVPLQAVRLWTSRRTRGMLLGLVGWTGTGVTTLDAYGMPCELLGSDEASGAARV